MAPVITTDRALRKYSLQVQVQVQWQVLVSQIRMHNSSCCISQPSLLLPGTCGRSRGRAPPPWGSPRCSPPRQPPSRGASLKRSEGVRARGPRLLQITRPDGSQVSSPNQDSSQSPSHQLNQVPDYASFMGRTPCRTKHCSGLRTKPAGQVSGPDHNICGIKSV